MTAYGTFLAIQAKLEERNAFFAQKKGAIEL
jgi:hypothetical protein